MPFIGSPSSRVPLWPSCPFGLGPPSTSARLDRLPPSGGGPFGEAPVRGALCTGVPSGAIQERRAPLREAPMPRGGVPVRGVGPAGMSARTGGRGCAGRGCAGRVCSAGLGFGWAGVSLVDGSGGTFPFRLGRDLGSARGGDGTPTAAPSNSSGSSRRSSGQSSSFGSSSSVGSRSSKSSGVSESSISLKSSAGSRSLFLGSGLT